MSSNPWYTGFLANVITKCGYQNWLSATVDEDLMINPSELALMPIEKVSKDDVAKWVSETTEYSIKIRDKHYLNENREEFRNLYNGEYWNEDCMDDYSSRVVTNWLKELVRSRASYATANNMVASAYSVESGDIGTEEFISDILSWVMYNNNFDLLSYDTRLESEILGTTYLRGEWDDEMSPPYGDVKIRLVPPDRMVTDWLAEDLQDGRFAGELHFRTIEQIKMAFPRKAKDFDGNISDTKGDIVDHKKKDMLMIIELFVSDSSTTTIIELISSEEGVPDSPLIEAKRTVRKYPNGRRIVVCDGILLSDEANTMEFRKNGIRFPFAVSKGSRQPHEQYGVSTVGEYESIVKDIIKREGAISDILEMFSHPITRVAKGQFKNARRQAIYGRNIIWEYNAKSNIPPPEIVTPPPGILSNNLTGLTHLKSDFQTLSGMVDVAIGQSSGSIQSGRGIIALQQRVDIKNGPMLKEHGATMKCLAKIVFSYVQVGYTEERLVRRKGENGTLEFTRINGTNELGETINDPTVGMFDIQFDVTTGAPTNYLARAEEAVQMGGAGFIDALTVIERSNWADKPKIVRRQVSMGKIHPLIAVEEGWVSREDPIIVSMLGQSEKGDEASPDAEEPVDGLSMNDVVDRGQ